MKVHRTIQQAPKGTTKKEGTQESLTKDIKLDPSVGQTMCTVTGCFMNLRNKASQSFSQVNCFAHLRIKFMSLSYLE